MVFSAISFILGFFVAVMLFAICTPFIWRRTFLLARKAVCTELPLSLKDVEADRDFLRTRQAVELCRLEQELEKIKKDDQALRLTLSRGREQISRADQLEAECKAQKTKIEEQKKKFALLKSKNQELKEKGRAALTIKNTDLVQFRRQIKIIAAQTAGFIAAKEGQNSPILQLVSKETAKQRNLTGGKSKQPQSLAFAILQEAGKAEAIKAAEAKQGSGKGRRPTNR